MKDTHRPWQRRYRAAMGPDELRLRAERFGVERGFWAAGEWVEPSEETLRGVLAAMRVGDGEWPRDDAWPGLVSTRGGGRRLAASRPAASAEDGSERSLRTARSLRDSPTGYHAVVGERGERTEPVVAEALAFDVACLSGPRLPSRTVRPASARCWTARCCCSTSGHRSPATGAT